MQIKTVWASALKGALSALIASSPISPVHGMENMRMEESFLLADIPVMIAAARPETILKSVSTVSVIDRNAIDRHGFASVSEALDTVAGLQVYRTHLKKRIPTIRGIVQEHYANKVLVMYDGVPAWNAVTGEGDPDRVDIDHVERIEVLKGPASVLYGSNAYTGAVNIVLKGAKDGKELGVVGAAGSGRGGYNGVSGTSRAGGYYASAGSNGSLFLSASASNEVWPDYSFRLENGATTSAPAGADTRLHEYVKSRNGTFHGTWGDNTVLINVSESDESSFGINISTALPSVGGGVGGAGRNHAIEGQLVNYTFARRGDKLGLKYAATYDRGRRNIPRSYDDIVRSNIVGSRVANGVRGDLTLGEALRLELGADHEVRQSHEYNNYNVLTNLITANNNMRGVSQWEWSGLGQVGLALGKLEVLVGSRYTKNQLFGKNVSSRGTAVYSINGNNSLKLIAGQSFRAPSIFELNFLTSPATVFGNKDLKPEKSESVEVVYVGGFGPFFVQALGYHATYKDTILRESTGVGTQTIYRNAPEFSARGTELELRYRRPKTNAYLNVGYLDGTHNDAPVGTNHYNFRYVPKQTLAAGVEQEVGPLFASAATAYRGQTRGVQGPVGTSITWNAALGWRGSSDRFTIEHSLSVKNASDEAVFVPEYVRRVLNALPLTSGRLFAYTFKLRYR